MHRNNRSSLGGIETIPRALLIALVLIAAWQASAGQPEALRLPSTVSVEGLKSFGTSGKRWETVCRGSCGSVMRQLDDDHSEVHQVPSVFQGTNFLTRYGGYHENAHSFTSGLDPGSLDGRRGRRASLVPHPYR
jgi:hypothetical protein